MQYTGCSLGTIAGMAYCWFMWYTVKTRLDAIAKESQHPEDQKVVKNWLIYSCVASVVAVIVLLILLVMRKRIALVVQLFT